MKNILLFTLLVIGIKALGQSSGGLDIAFNTDGKHTVDINGNETGQAVAIQPNGRIVTAGNNGSQVIVTRLLANGQPDLTFSVDGETSTTIPNGGQVEVGDVTLQGDGKIVVVGTVVDQSNFNVNLWDFIIVRFLANGNLDTSFDGDGILKVASGGYQKYSAVKIHQVNKLLVAGISNGSFIVQRRLTDGSLDTSFGINGTAAIGIGGEATSIELFGIFGIVIGGNETMSIGGVAANNFAVVKLNYDGTLDTSFSGDGKQITDISGFNSDDEATDISVDSENRIVLVGYTYVNGLANEVAVVRYLPNGDLDLGFAGTGKKIFPVSSSTDIATSVEILPDDQIVIAGSTVTAAYSYTVILPGGIFQVINVPANEDMLVMLIDSYGAINTTFGINGIARVAFEEGKQDNAFGMALQPDGKVVVVGSAVFGTNIDFAFFRMHTIYGFKHLEDTMYASLGNYDDKGESISVDVDGNLFVGATIYNGTNFTWHISKYKDTGLLDNSFSSDGKVTFSSTFLPQPARVSKIFAQADGKIIIAGSSLLNGQVVFTIIRLLSNGSLDVSFDGDGKKTIQIKSGGDYCTGLKTMIGGKIVLSGNSYENANTFVTVVRLNSDGSLDTSFDTDGINSINVSPTFREATDLDILVDKIFVGGRVFNPEGFFAMKFNTDGSLDNTFDGDGLAFTTFNGLSAEGRSIKVQSDGKILVGGAVDDKLCIIKFNSNGSLDNGFANNGVFTYNIQTYGGKVESIISNTDGSFIAGGTVDNQLRIFKLNANGSFNGQFGYAGQKGFKKIGYSTSSLRQIIKGPQERFYAIGTYNNGLNDDIQLGIFMQCKEPVIYLGELNADINTIIIDPYLAQQIIASNIILAGGNVKYEGVKNIILEPGFKADAASVFSAKIKANCSYSTVPIGNN